MLLWLQLLGFAGSDAAEPVAPTTPIWAERPDDNTTWIEMDDSSILWIERDDVSTLWVERADAPTTK